MKRSKQKQRQAFHSKRRTINAANPTTHQPALKMAFWNVNGLGCSIKKKLVVDILEEQQLSLMGLAETHLREGHHGDLSMFKGYRIITAERWFGDKMGGGLMILVKDGVNHSVYNWQTQRTQGQLRRKAGYCCMLVNQGLRWVLYIW